MQEKEAWSPQPFRRQKKRRGEEKRKSRLRYMKNKTKLRLKAKKYRNKLKRNPAWKRFQKKRQKEHARRRRIAMFQMSRRVAHHWLSKQASLAKLGDLGRALGWEGGPCGLIERVKDELPPRQQPPVIDAIQKGRSFPERAVYRPHSTKGPWKFDMELTPHTQYRMDLRSVTEPEIRAALGSFFKEVNEQRSKGDNTVWNKFTSNERMEYMSTRLHNLVVVFQLDRSGKEIDIITTYRKGEPDPRGSCPSL